MRPAWIFLLLLLPAADALSVQFDADGGIGIDIRESWSGQFFIDVECTEMLPGIPTTTVDFAYTKSSRMKLDAPTSLEIPYQDCLPELGPLQVAVPMTVWFNESTNAMEPVPLDIVATIAGGEPAAAMQVFFANYYGELEATVPIHVKQGGPQKEIGFEIELRNLGNGQTRVNFQAITPDLNGMVLVPGPVILDAAGGGKDRTTTFVYYSTPFDNGPNSDQEAFQVRATPEYALNPDWQGEPILMDFQGNTKGMYVPGPGLVALAALVLGTAAARRRL